MNEDRFLIPPETGDVRLIILDEIMNAPSESVEYVGSLFPNFSDAEYNSFNAASDDHRTE